MAEKCSAALPTIGRIMRPTKNGLSPIWCATGSIVLTSTSLTKAVTTVTPARTAIGNQREVLHQTASVANSPEVVARRCGAVSTAGVDDWAGFGFSSAVSFAVDIDMGSTSLGDARTPKTE